MMFAHCTPLFYSLLAEIGNPRDGFLCRTYILQGGTYGAKTWEMLQLSTMFASMTKLKICVAGSTLPHLRSGALDDLETILSSTPELRRIFPDNKRYRNKSTRTFRCINGSKITLDSFDERKATGPKYDIVFFNEVIKIPYEVFDPLHTRAMLTLCDYNSAYKFYIHDMIGQPGVKFGRCNHTHNDAIPQSKHEEIEARRDDVNWYTVYGEGKTGQTEGQIFKYSIVETMPEYAKCVGYGMDFGFARDPTTIIGVWQSDGELYLKELLYGAGILVNDLAAYMKELNLHKVEAPIWGDSAAASTIGELVVRGLPVRSVSKPTIAESISVVQRFKLNVLAGSNNLIHELSAYCWQTSPTGASKPPSYNDHLLDPLRYLVWSELRTPDGTPHKATSVYVAGKKRLTL
jgi:phage terminase large subunit